MSVIHRELAPDHISLVHAMHGHPGDVSTLAILVERLYRSTTKLDVR